MSVKNETLKNFGGIKSNVLLKFSASTNLIANSILKLFLRLILFDIIIVKEMQ
jgi:hypothetical protein